MSCHRYTAGWAGDRSGRCRCAVESVQRYRGRVSGPLMDRIDLHVEVPRLDPHELRDDTPYGEDSATVRARVVAAREVQLARSGVPNAQLLPADLARHCRLDPPDRQLLEDAVERLQLSARSMHRILRVARTLADLAGSEAIATAHVAEAIGYRQLDRGGGA
ncbi:MAG: ATP-binding protein [Glutamicibacter sp.]